MVDKDAESGYQKAASDWFRKKSTASCRIFTRKPDGFLLVNHFFYCYQHHEDSYFSLKKEERISLGFRLCAASRAQANPILFAFWVAEIDAWNVQCRIKIDPSFLSSGLKRQVSLYRWPLLCLFHWKFISLCDKLNNYWDFLLPPCWYIYIYIWILMRRYLCIRVMW